MHTVSVSMVSALDTPCCVHIPFTVIRLEVMVDGDHAHSLC